MPRRPSVGSMTFDNAVVRLRGLVGFGDPVR
jgi:hypothetical protein